MNITQALNIVSNTFHKQKAEFTLESKKNATAKKKCTSRDQIVNFYNHLNLMVLSHGFPLDSHERHDIVEFFDLILNAPDEFVSREKMPESWPSYRTWSLAFESLGKCLEIEALKQRLVRHFQEDGLDKLKAACDQYRTSYLRQYNTERKEAAAAAAAAAESDGSESDDGNEPCDGNEPGDGSESCDDGKEEEEISDVDSDDSDDDKEDAVDGRLCAAYARLLRRCTSIRNGQITIKIKELMNIMEELLLR
jgi:hypothetical protein